MRPKKILCGIIACMLAGCNTSSGSGTGTSNDTSAPYINIKNYEYTTNINTPIDFSNITGYDDVDGLLNTSVEGYIDYSQPGDYYPKITCTDLSGNESEVGITVHVLDTVDVASAVPSETPTAQDQTAAEGCDVKGAMDSSKPCDEVLPGVTDPYQTIYEGEAGKDKCETAASNSTNGSCTAIYRNDGQLWGYGYTSAPVQEPAVPDPAASNG